MLGVMIAGEASRTALLVAGCRAHESAEEGAICDDYWADAIAGPEGRKLAEAVRRTRPALSLYIAIRTAFLDAQVRHWTAAPHGFDQVVLLGAGLDTRAARLAVAGVRFFEVDHPATQADKRRRLLPRRHHGVETGLDVTVVGSHTFHVHVDAKERPPHGSARLGFGAKAQSAP